MPSREDRSPWSSHDWKVKTLESLTGAGGSRLGFTCRSCERRFSYTTSNHRAWAVNNDGVSLADEITSRWLAQPCPGRPPDGDDEDRRHLKYPK